MIGAGLVLLAFAFIVLKSLSQPWIGVVGMYGFLALDPRWNWRWALPSDIRFQYWIFIALTIGSILSGMKLSGMSKSASRATLLGLIFVLWTVLCNSLSQYPEYGSVLIGILWKILLLGFFAVVLIDNPRKLHLTLAVVAIGAGYNSWGLTSDFLESGFFRFSYDRSWGTRGLDNNGVGIYFTPPFAVALGLCFTSRNWKGFMLFGLCSACLAHSYMLLETRGGMLGAMTTAILIFLFMPKIPNNRILFILLTFFVISLAGAAVVEEFSSIFASQEERDGSAESRFLLWEAGYKLTMANPLVGVGPDQARFYVPQVVFFGDDVEVKALHNLFFDLSTGMGIPGLILFLGIYLPPWLLCLTTYRRDRLEDQCLAPRYIVLCGLPGYFVASCFSASVNCETGLFLVVVGYCVSCIDLRQSKIHIHTDNTDAILTYG